MNDSVELPKNFAKFGIEVILDAVVGSVCSRVYLPGIFIADLVVELDEHEFLLDGPFNLSSLHVDVVLVATCQLSYRSRHCLALLRGRLYSEAIFFAIILQFRIPYSSYSFFSTSSSSSDQIFF